MSEIKCTGNNGNGCFMDSCAIDCGCEGLKEFGEKLKNRRKMKINKTIPKDNSNYTYYDDVGLDLKCTKPLLIILKKGYPRFDVGVYVHRRKEWLDKMSFHIETDNVLGWIDFEEYLKEML